MSITIYNNVSNSIPIWCNSCGGEIGVNHKYVHLNNSIYCIPCAIKELSHWKEEAEYDLKSLQKASIDILL